MAKTDSTAQELAALVTQMIDENNNNARADLIRRISNMAMQAAKENVQPQPQPFTLVTPAQMEVGLSQIASMALALKGICTQAIDGDDDGNLRVAARSMASEIGLIADRCLGFDINGGIDEWLLPPSFEAKKEASHETA